MTENNQQDKKEIFFSENTGKQFAIGGIIFIILAAIIFIVFGNWTFSHTLDEEKIAQYGDFIGGIIGSLFSLAGVILFYVALTEQRDDIRTNREVLKTQVNALEQQIKEFELQREELELTREVFIDQSKTLKLQQFESTFFNSMNLLNNIIQSITYIVPPLPRLRGQPVLPQPDKTIIYNGRDSFEFFYKDLKKEYQALYSDYIMKNLGEVSSPGAPFNVPIKIKNDFANIAYENFFEQQHSDLGHYFRTIYNIVKFINDRKPDNPKYYTSLLRSQLSTYEHLLLFYNCHSTYGIEKFKPLIIEYSMLDNMAISELLDNVHKDLYPEKAYE